MDLTPYAGKAIHFVFLVTDGDTAAGPWDVYYQDIALVSPDGTVRPIYNRGSSVSLSIWPGGGVTERSYEINQESGAQAAEAADETTTYYTGDTLGSERMMTSAQGYPVWQAMYSPFGTEVNPQITPNSWKFAGTETDSETGLNNAEFRQYSSIVHRWLSPDPLGGDITNPQSLNRYAYALNNPTNMVDPLGLSAGDPCNDEEYFISHAECGGRLCDPDDFNCCDPAETEFDCITVGGGGPLSPLDEITSAPPPPQGCILYGSPLQCAGISFPGASGNPSGIGDPFTAQIGGAVNVTFGGFTFTYFAGLAIDLHGRVAVYAGGGGGQGAGVGGSAGVQVGDSNGDTVCDLGGPFANASGTFGVEGASGTVDAFQGAGHGPGGSNTVTGGTVTLGGGGGAAASVGGTGTKVVPLTGGSCK